MKTDDNSGNHEDLSNQALEPAATSEPVPAIPRTEEPKPEQDHSSGNQPPILTKDSSIAVPRKPARDRGKRDIKEIVNTTANCLIAVATVIGVIFLIEQWSQTEEALEQTREANRLIVEAQKIADLDSVEDWKRFERQIAIAGQSTQAAIDSVTQTKKSADAAVESARVAQQALNNASQNFIRDQQPYVLIESSRPERIAANEIVFWRIDYKNYGRSPAVNVRGAGKVFAGRNTKDQIERFLAGLPRRLREINTNVLPPNGADSNYSSPRMDRPLSIEEHSLIQKVDFALVVAGRLEYEDVSGNIYQSDFCYGPLATGAIAGCFDFNKVRQVKP